MSKYEFYATIPHKTLPLPSNRISQLLLYENKSYVEWLFDEPTHFLWLLRLLIRSKNFQLYAGFMRSLDYTELNRDALFYWTKVTRSNVISHLLGMKKYALNLQCYHRVKGLVLNQLSNKLLRQLTREPKMILTDPEYLNQLKRLAFKLRLKEIVHSQDAVLNTHRHHWWLAANLMVVVLTGGALHVFNLILNNSLLFFRATKSLSQCQQFEAEAILQTSDKNKDLPANQHPL